MSDQYDTCTDCSEEPCVCCIPAGVSDTPETKPCEHDYFNPRVKGRARYHCPMCDADISLEVVMLVEQEMDDKAKEDAKDHEAP